jgi:hypothetical protein
MQPQGSFDVAETPVAVAPFLASGVAVAVE